MSVQGIHHITAISSDAQATLDFYSGVLGLRLVKKSVNQDDVKTYHLFFGNREGHPGMDLTFFPFQPTFPGKLGVGQVTTISLSVPVGSLSFWKERCEKFHVSHGEITEQFGHHRMHLTDKDGQSLELVEDAAIAEEYIHQVWTTEEIDNTKAIHCFHSATLTVSRLVLIEPILFLLGYEKKEETQDRVLYVIPACETAARLQVIFLNDGQDAHSGAGTVHHIAFRVKDLIQEKQLREELIDWGLYPTEVIDRYYFQSVYFRIPAGILFELATEGPGFTADEESEELGTHLALPPFLESRRAEIEAELPHLQQGMA